MAASPFPHTLEVLLFLPSSVHRTPQAGCDVSGLTPCRLCTRFLCQREVIWRPFKARSRVRAVSKHSASQSRRTGQVLSMSLEAGTWRQPRPRSPFLSAFCIRVHPCSKDCDKTELLTSYQSVVQYGPSVSWVWS